VGNRTAPAEGDRGGAALLSRYIREKLRRRDTYVTALVVGVVINAYGQLLVPWLRGRSDPWAVFMEKVESDPALTAVSVGLGFLFPLLVGVYSSVATRWSSRQLESRAQFPDAKPDPVFRASLDGEILDAGETTRALFDKYNVARAADVVGGAVWEQLAAAARAGKALTRQPRIYFEKADAWYLVATSPTPDNHVNVYLTHVVDEDQDHSGGTDD
jgi:hypothetical protein